MTHPIPYAAPVTPYTWTLLMRTLQRVPRARFFKRRVAKEPDVSIGDPRLDAWETVSTFEDLNTAVAWRDQLRAMGIDASCLADHPLDRLGRGDIYLVVAPEQWSEANEILENIGDDA